MSNSTGERVLGTGKRTARSFFSLIVVGIAIIPVALFLFSKFGRFLFWAEIINNFRFQIMCLLVPFPLLLWAAGNRRFALLSTVLLAWSVAGVYYVHIPPLQPPPGERVLRIMSINVFDHNYQVREVRKEISRKDADVVVVAEYCQHWMHALEPLHEDYPFRILEPRWHGFGVAIFSKHPLSDTRIYLLHEERTDVPFVTTRVETGNTPIRIGAVHTLSPSNRLRLDLRNDQFAEIGRKLNSEDDVPTVLIGDFNAPPWSPYLKDLCNVADLRDSRQGFGYQGSWHTTYWMLTVPIDNAFVSPDIHVHDRYLGRDCGSDHLPLIIEVSTR
ncbi:MAG: endonuclease/exonuclease/phosphatase family protein [Planctomycetota bacterium]